MVMGFSVVMLRLRFVSFPPSPMQELVNGRLIFKLCDPHLYSRVTENDESEVLVIFFQFRTTKSKFFIVAQSYLSWPGPPPLNLFEGLHIY